MRCNTQNEEFKDFKDHFQNSRIYQGSSKILIEIQTLVKDFKDRHEIQGFKGCGNPGLCGNETGICIMMKWTYW